MTSAGGGALGGQSGSGLIYGQTLYGTLSNAQGDPRSGETYFTLLNGNNYSYVTSQLIDVR